VDVCSHQERNAVGRRVVAVDVRRSVHMRAELGRALIGCLAGDCARPGFPSLWGTNVSDGTRAQQHFLHEPCTLFGNGATEELGG